MMFERSAISSTRTLLLAGILAGAAIALPATAQSPAAAGQSPVAVSSNHNRLDHFPRRAELYYGNVWGVDSLVVKLAESGELIRFSYRVLDPKKAAPLNDKKAQPLLIDPQARVQLVVPSVDKIGPLRQTNAPETGKSYWMAFSNKGRLVKRGARVIVAIGPFRADGLEVQ